METNSFFVAVLIGGSSLLYTNFLVNKLDLEERKKIELWAEATDQLANSGMGLHKTMCWPPESYKKIAPFPSY